jgi:hypothetical protein
MASIPLAANRIEPPPDITQKLLQSLQIKGLLLGQQYTQGALQSQGISNQQRQMDLDAQQKIISAQRDPAWDATDSDKTVQLMNHYQVPIEYQQRVLQGINQTRQLMQSQSAEQIGATAKFHEFLDDQYQGVNDAPPGERQSAWEEAKQNALNYANALPPGPARDLAAKQMQAIPALYDPTFVAREHGLLKTVTQLNQEALSRAQQFEATSKGLETSQAAANAAGKSDPSSPLFEPTPAATAIGAQAGSPWATAAQTGEAKQAGAVEAAKAAAQFPYQKQLETIRQQVSMQFQQNKDATDKIESSVLKPYQDKMTTIGELQSAIDQAAQGNIASARAALYKTIGVAQPAGTHRVAPTEVTGFSGMGGIPERIRGSIANALSGDPWTPQMVKDIKSFADGQAGVAQANLNRGIGNVNRLYGTNVGTGLVQAGGAPPPGATHTVLNRADGKMHWTDAQNSKDMGVAE